MRLSEDVAKLLIEKINSNFNAKYNYKNNKNYSYQIILQDNLQQLATFIVNKRKEFEFSIPKIHLNGSNTTSLNEKIINITLQQRKQLGINKSTIHYLKNNLLQGKKIKVYSKTFSKLKQL